jgi:peptidoglycan/xylan/chitin deacetylase (PgdA/CDA1 family)
VLGIDRSSCGKTGSELAMKLAPYAVAKIAYDWSSRMTRRSSHPHGFILMYHRVASPLVDPWKISVSEDNFAEQMRALREIADVVPLEDLPHALRKGRRSKTVAAVTFDDGYLDNLLAAKPVLDTLDIPATVFVPTGWIGNPRPMWWDRLAHALLATEMLPPDVELFADGQDFSWHETAVNGTGLVGRRARSRLHRTVWTKMRKLPDDNARQSLLDALVEILGTDETPVRDYRPMTTEELHRLVANGRISIGSHSVTHPTLPGIDRDAKAWEIETSARQFEEIFGNRPTTFAYPYGDLDEESVQFVRSSGYTVACSTRQDLMWADDDPHLLPRIGVNNWSVGEFRKRLGWFWLA